MPGGFPRFAGKGVEWRFENDDRGPRTEDRGPTTEYGLRTALTLSAKLIY